MTRVRLQHNADYARGASARRLWGLTVSVTPDAAWGLRASARGAAWWSWLRAGSWASWAADWALPADSLFWRSMLATSTLICHLRLGSSPACRRLGFILATVVLKSACASRSACCVALIECVTAQGSHTACRTGLVLQSVSLGTDVSAGTSLYLKAQLSILCLQRAHFGAELLI